MKAEKSIRIKLDVNDADYVEKTSPITDDELEVLKPIIDRIPKKRHNFKYLSKMVDELDGEYCCDWFHDKFMPSFREWPHTVIEIELYEETGKKKLFEQGKH